MTTKLISLCLLLSASLCQADNIIIPVGSQSNQQVHVQLPAKGMAQVDVLAQYGEPLAKSPATGEPPISRWRYPNFSVYFESEVVIHSVLAHQPVNKAEAAQQE